MTTKSTTGPSTRRRFFLERFEAEKLDRLANAKGMSRSRYLASVVEDFVKNGSKRPRARRDQVAMFIPEDVLEKADKRALDEYGVGLLEIIRHEIATRSPR